MRVVGLSLVQPVPWRVLVLEERSVYTTEERMPHGVEEILLHASASANQDTFDAAIEEMVRRGLPAGITPPWHRDLPRGGFVARARVVAIDPGARIALTNVRPLPCLVPARAPAAGQLFQVDEQLLERATAAALAAKSETEFRAVERLWVPVQKAKARTKRAAAVAQQAGV